MKLFIVKKNEGGQRLDKLLTKQLKYAPPNFLYKMLRKKNITLNGKKATGSEIVNLSDEIRFFLSDETFQKFSIGESLNSDEDEVDFYFNLTLPRLEVLYEDEDILIINKPTGMLSQKAAVGDVSANEYIIAYLLQSGKLGKEEFATFRPSVCNRLDRNTSGLLIAGKSLKGLQEMGRELKSRSLQKFYRCIVFGTITKNRHLTAYLKKDDSTNKVRVSDTEKEGYQQIETDYRPISQGNGFTLLEVHLITGRSHQIRAHLAYMGAPIVGDEKYGDRKGNQDVRAAQGVTSQLLHSYRIVFSDGKTIISEPPEIFRKILIKS